MYKLAQSMVSPKPLSGAAIEHGKKYESVAVQWFERECKRATREAGLFVSVDYPFLGASPDRVIDDKQLLEVKCPYSAKDNMITPVTVPYLEMCNDGLILKKSHAYFDQVQGQLLCSDRDVCHFLVFTFKDQKVITIRRDEDFIAQIAVYLDKQFFKNYITLLKNYYSFKYSY